MAIYYTPYGDGVTLDETLGLQFNGSGDNTAGVTDNDDNDVALSFLQTNASDFYDRLFDIAELNLDDSFATDNGVAYGQIATVSTDGTPITAISFSFTDGDSSGIFDLDGNELFLYADPENSDIVFLREGSGTTADPNGDIAAAIYLDVDVDGASSSEDVYVWMVQFEAFANTNPADPDDTLTLANLSLGVSSLLEFDFTGAPPGQNYFMMFGDSTAALLVSGRDPATDSAGSADINDGDTTNTSMGGGPTTLAVSNQKIDDGEGMYFSYVSGANPNYTVPNLDQNEADVEANIQFTGFINTTGAIVDIVQLQPASGAANVSITAFLANDPAADEDGTDYAEGIHNDTQVDVIDVQVIRGGVVIESFSGPENDPDIEISIVGGVATITGVLDGDRLAFTTDGVHNRSLIEHAGTVGDLQGADFDIGGYAILSSDEDTFAINNILFDDDGPTADIADGGGEVTVDETAGLQDDDTLSGAVSGLFTGVLNTGSDGAAFPQYATNATPLVDVSGSDPGQDNEGATTVISLAIVGGDNTDSGLTTTNSALPILLVKEGDLIVGRVDSEGDGDVTDGDAGDVAAFAIAINQDGTAAIAQWMSLDHPNAADPDDTVDLTGLVNAVVTVTDGDGDVDTDTFGIGDKLNFDDDFPTLADPANTLVAFVDSTAVDPLDSDVAAPGFEADGDDIVPIDFDPGQDDEGASLAIVDFTDPDNLADLAASGLDDLEALVGDITATSSDTTVTYWTDGGTVKLFELNLDTTDPEAYEFQVFQDTPVVFQPLDFSTFKSGGPVETIAVATGDGLTTATFDGYLFGGADGREITSPLDLPDDDPTDYLNPDEHGFGIKALQASNINNNEGWQMVVTDTGTGTPLSVQGIQFAFDAQGNTDDVVLAFQLSNTGVATDLHITNFAGTDPLLGLTNDYGTVALADNPNDGISEFFLYTQVPGGNNDLIVTIISDSLFADYVATQKADNEIVIAVDGPFDEALWKATYPQDLTPIEYDAVPFENDSIRVKDFNLIQSIPVDDITLSFDVQGTDGDGDTTLVQTFEVTIDGDGDGMIG